MEHSPEPRETTSHFEKLLAALVASGVDYLSPADLILLKKDSWREKDKLDVQAMREIVARERQP
ncbi:MAG TPA: hypothetical protein VMU04_10790 [Candidatus Acidoferrum sp.]|nr:hypothetical protein [Candidatus Acidoferrum sp.]